MRRFVCLLAMFCLFSVMLPAHAREGDDEKKPAKEEKEKGKEEKGKEEGDEKGREKKRGERVPDKTKIVFVTKTKAEKGKKAEELVWIRLTPVQYRSAKGRSRFKRRGAVRILLGPRQLKELNEILKKDEKSKDETKKPIKKVAIRVRAKRMRQRKGVKAHFVVRPLSLFTKTWKNNEIEEPEPKGEK